ncbi:MAG: Xaa-Pro aminopeptidase [Gammaproteobacteria bacterium]|nr:Xaa-Pro aminopeptidase [Gammaproteobacteria bacterium]
MREYAGRRRRLMQVMGPGSVAILPAAPLLHRNRDVEYPYRQHSDFSYLSGFPEPEAVIVLVPGRRRAEFLLFCRPRDPAKEQWTGPRIGPEGACRLYGADAAYPIDAVDDVLPRLLEGRDKVFYTMGSDIEFDQRLTGWVKQVRDQARSGVHAPVEFVSLDHHLHDMRLYKSRHEIVLMRRAAQISALGHRRAMQQCRPGVMEYQIEGEILHEFMQHGCRSPAYPTIAGGGANACVLHYTDNNRSLRDGELLLVDAGAEYRGYAGDITRTYPVNGRFSPEQRALYELVLAAQLTAIRQVRPGKHWNDPHHAAVRTLTKGLVELGLLKGTVATLIKKEAYRRFYMHRTGHWLGMDVHDVGEYKVGNAWRLLEPGMVLTVEPGLYVTPQRGVAKKWWNIGIRIEDDVLVTRDGCEILSRDVPKSVADIEALMAGAAG